MTLETSSDLTLRGDLLIATIQARLPASPPVLAALRTADATDLSAVTDLIEWALDTRFDRMPDAPLPPDAVIRAAGCRSAKSFHQGTSHVSLTSMGSDMHVGGSYNDGVRGCWYSADRQAHVPRDGDMASRLIGLMRDPSLSTREPRATLLDAVVDAGREHVPRGRADVDLLFGLDADGDVEWAGRWWHAHGYEDIDLYHTFAKAVRRLREEEASHGWTPWTAICATIHPRRRTDRAFPFFRWDRPELHPSVPWGSHYAWATMAEDVRRREDDAKQDATDVTEKHA